MSPLRVGIQKYLCTDLDSSPISIGSAESYLNSNALDSSHFERRRTYLSTKSKINTNKSKLKLNWNEKRWKNLKRKTTRNGHIHVKKGMDGWTRLKADIDEWNKCTNEWTWEEMNVNEWIYSQIEGHLNGCVLNVSWMDKYSFMNTF